MNGAKVFHLTKTIGESNTECILRIIDGVMNGAQKLILDWKEVDDVAPAGISLLTLLYDYLCIRGVTAESINVSKVLYEIPIVKLFLKVKNLGLKRAEMLCINGAIGNFQCLEKESFSFNKIQSTDVFFERDVREIASSLMKNCREHSQSDRIYCYQSVIENTVYMGFLDMGVGIKAKLQNFLRLSDDCSYIENAFQNDISSKTLCDGGLGLYQVLQTCRRYNGKVICLSGFGQVRWYLKNRRIDRKTLKYYVPGTWIFVQCEV